MTLVGCILRGALSCLVFVGVLDSSVAISAEEPVAIVCLLSGKSFANVDGKQSELELFQRLRPGTIVRTEARSKVVLALFTGDRYELGELSSATLGRTSLERTKGSVSQLSRVAAIVDIAPIAKTERPGTRMAGTRIRTGGSAARSIPNIYPSAGATTVSATTVVRFDPVAGYGKYRIELEDEKGMSLFVVETASTEVQLPPDVLRPDRSYYWTVRALDAGKPALRGEAVFWTLKEDDARRRAKFKVQVDEAADVTLLLLLAELDRSLGLRKEACDALSVALDRGADEGSMGAARARFGCSRD
jgi:hypothetical protein